MNRRFSLLALLLAVAVMFAFVPASRANTISIGLQEDGGALVTVASSVSGNAAFSGAFGTFVVNNISGTGSPFLNEPNFFTQSLNLNSTGSHTLKVFVTELGLTSAVPGFVSGFTSNIFNGAINSVLEQTFISFSNGLYGGTLLSSQTFTGIGSTTAQSFLAGSGTYSLTAAYTITTSGSGVVDDTIAITAVPEPGSMALLGTGLSGLAAMLRRRQKTVKL